MKPGNSRGFSPYELKKKNKSIYWCPKEKGDFPLRIAKELICSILTVFVHITLLAVSEIPPSSQYLIYSGNGHCLASTLMHRPTLHSPSLLVLTS